jgi:hypothetical protein
MGHTFMALTGKIECEAARISKSFISNLLWHSIPYNHANPIQHTPNPPTHTHTSSTHTPPPASNTPHTPKQDSKLIWDQTFRDYGFSYSFHIIYDFSFFSGPSNPDSMLCECDSELVLMVPSSNSTDFVNVWPPGEQLLISSIVDI